MLCYLRLNIKKKKKLTSTKFDSRKCLYSIVIFFSFTRFILYSFQYTDISSPLLRSFDRFLLSFADKVTAETYWFVSLIVKIILELASSFSKASVSD